MKSIAVIGSHADVGVLSGGGSAQVDPPGGNALATASPGWRAGRPWGPRWDVRPWPGLFSHSPLKAIRAKVPKAKVEFNDGDRSRGGGGAGQELPKWPLCSSISRRAKGAMPPRSDAARKAGRAGERRGRRQSAHHRGAGDRRSGDDAVDRQGERRPGGLVPGNPRRRGDRQHPVRRREPVGQAAGHFRRRAMPTCRIPRSPDSISRRCPRPEVAGRFGGGRGGLPPFDIHTPKA